MNSPGNDHPKPRFTRWFGPSAFMALLVVIVGRFVLEPLRNTPQFDKQGMDPFHAVETYVLRKDHHPIDLAFFGSSQSVWGILSENIANELELNPRAVRNLASPGGTPFEMWHLVQRNGEDLSRLRCAVVEINPFILRDSLDDDPRVLSSVSQQGSFSERMMLHEREDRLLLAGEWVLPLNSVRRSLGSAVLGVLKPDPGSTICPRPDFRTRPFALWRVRPGTEDCAIQRLGVTADSAARRFVLRWAPSRLQDFCLRSLLSWFDEHHIPVLMHQPPVHPDVVRALRKNKDFARSYDDFIRYIAALRPAPLEFVSAFDPADCGLAEIHLSDRTHLNEMGARAYSRFLAEKIATLQEQTGLQASVGRPKGVAKQ